MVLKRVGGINIYTATQTSLVPRSVYVCVEVNLCQFHPGMIIRPLPQCKPKFEISFNQILTRYDGPVHLWFFRPWPLIKFCSGYFPLGSTRGKDTS